MKMTEMFPSNYLKKEDLPHPIVLTIANVTQEEVSGDGGKELKAVIHWREKQYKSMIVNKGNATTICDMYGDDSDGWHGKQIEVYSDPSIMFAGKRTGGIRVRAPHHGNGNGITSFGAVQPPMTAWTFAQAIEECAKVGISKDGLIAALKNAGKNEYSMVRDTPAVQALISVARTQRQPGDEPVESFAGVDESIPF